jgi:hypothetical protein
MLKVPHWPGIGVTPVEAAMKEDRMPGEPYWDRGRAMSGRGCAPSCMKVFSLWRASPTGPGGADLRKCIKTFAQHGPGWRLRSARDELSKHRQGKYIGERKLMIACMRVTSPSTFAQTETGTIRPACV